MTHRLREIDDEEDEGEEEADEPRLPPRRRRHRSRALAPWEGSTDATDESEEDEEDEEAEIPPRWRRVFSWKHPPVFFRARDSLWFEPLVALAIVVLILVSLWAFTQNWPPIYVVESESMQHGTTDQLGLINTGDMVLAQRIPVGQIQPYVVGLVTGYVTYGEYGDVLLYAPNGDSSVTPVIHRALLYLVPNSDGTVSAPELSGLSCGTGNSGVYTVSSTANGCGWSHITGTLTLHQIGWQSVNVTISLNGGIGSYPGFITLGDGNLAGSPPTQGLTDQQTGKSGLVRSSWIIGVARGMIPWFGAVKLLLEGNAGQVPSQSWELLGITVIGAILGSMMLHYVFRAEGFEDERRIREESQAEDGRKEDDVSDRPRVRRRSFFRPLRAWSSRDDEDDTEVPRQERRAFALPSRHLARGHGRPRPKVRRDVRHVRRQRDSDDEL